LLRNIQSLRFNLIYFLYFVISVDMLPAILFYSSLNMTESMVIGMEMNGTV